MERENDEYEYKERASAEQSTLSLEREPMLSVERDSIDAESFRQDEFNNNR